MSIIRSKKALIFAILEDMSYALRTPSSMAGPVRSSSPVPVYAEDFSILTTVQSSHRLRVARDKIRVLN